MDAEALAVFAMPAKALAFSTILYIVPLIADALAGIAKPAGFRRPLVQVYQ